MKLGEIIEQTEVNFPKLLGIQNLGNELEEPGPHFVIILKVLEKDYSSLLNANNIEPILTFVPTEYFPNLWFRLQVAFGSKGPDSPPSYFFCEYNFCIILKDHIEILNDLNRADNFTLLYAKAGSTIFSYYHFNISTETKENIKIEIEACKNGISLYKNLDVDKCLQGQHEIEASREVSGKIKNEKPALEQSTKRLRVKPFSKNADIVFTNKKKSW